MKTKILFVVITLASFEMIAQNKIESTGNVGIGTTSPLSKLTIKGLDSEGWNSGI